MLSITLILGLFVFNGTSFAEEQSNLKAFINKQLTKKQIRKYLRESSNIKSVKSDATFRLVYEPSEAMKTQLPTEDQSLDLSATLDMSSNTILNFLRYGDEKFQVAANVTGKARGEIISFSGELRMVNETFYGIVKAFPSYLLEDEPELVDKQGRWFSYKVQNMDEIRRLFSSSSNSKVNSMLSDAELDKVIELLSSDVIQKRYTKSTYETVDGIKSTCLNFKYTGQQFYELIQKINELSDFEDLTSTVEDYSAIKTLNLGMCSDDELKNGYKVSFNLVYESDETGKIIIEFNQDNYNHNQDLAVEVPANAEPLDQTINDEIAQSGLDLVEIESSMEQVNQISAECKNLGGTEFPDVTSNFNEYESILYSKNNGIIKGYSDGCFRPYNEITREQLTAVLIRGKHTPEEIAGCSDLPYPDVDMNNKLRGEICLAKKHGYVSGYSDGGYRPSRYITIEEASKMISNVYGINKSDVDNTEYKFNSYMSALDDIKAFPDVVGCRNDLALRADITEILYRVRNNITTKEYTSLDTLKAC